MEKQEFLTKCKEATDKKLRREFKMKTDYERTVTPDSIACVLEIRKEGKAPERNSAADWDEIIEKEKIGAFSSYQLSRSAWTINSVIKSVDRDHSLSPIPDKPGVLRVIADHLEETI